MFCAISIAPETTSSRSTSFLIRRSSIFLLSTPAATPTSAVIHFFSFRGLPCPREPEFDVFYRR